MGPRSDNRGYAPSTQQDDAQSHQRLMLQWVQGRRTVVMGLRRRPTVRRVAGFNGSTVG